MLQIKDFSGNQTETRGGEFGVQFTCFYLLQEGKKKFLTTLTG